MNRAELRIVLPERGTAHDIAAALALRARLGACLEGTGWTVREPQEQEPDPAFQAPEDLTLYLHTLPSLPCSLHQDPPALVWLSAAQRGAFGAQDLLEGGVQEVLEPDFAPEGLPACLEQALLRARSWRRHVSVLEDALSQLPGNLLIYPLEDGKPLYLNRPDLELSQLYLEPALRGEPIGLRGFHPDGSPYQPGEWPLLRTLSRQETVQGERIEVERGGERRVLALSSAPLPHRSPSPQAISLYVEDLTEAVQHERWLERGLEQSQSRYRLMLETAHEGVWVLDAQDRTTYVNPRMCELLGYTPEQMLGQTLWSFLHPDEIASQRTDRSGVQPLEREQFELRFGTRTGGLCWVLGTTTALVDERGVHSGSLGLFADITDRKQAERALLERELRLYDALERQRRFVSDASHELRAPLTTIQGNLELLRRFPRMSPEDHREAILDTEREASRLSRLVGDLLILARADTGQQIRRSPLRLDTLLGEVFSQVRGLARGQRLHLGRLEPLRVCGDRLRLEQLALILLENALKHTPQGGEVRLELLHEDGEARLRISDQGSGIAPHDLPHVFERFYRADPARVRGETPGGTGLGLSIAQWIVEGHGGQIWLESQLERGTVAQVLLPALEG